MTVVPVDLVIFDCDGVLVDSEPLAMRALLETISEAGLHLETSLGYERFLGRSLAAICETLSEDFGIDLTHDALDRMRVRLFAMFRSELKAMDGVHEALETLPVPCCVASSSHPERLALALSVTGLTDRFGANVFSTTLVPRGKPAPDLFLFAAERMAKEPAHSLVVEDSPAGIQAARSAGMRVCAFTGGSHAGDAHRDLLESFEPDHVIDNMRRLPSLILQDNAR